MQKRARPGALAGATGAAVIFDKLAGHHEDIASTWNSQHRAVRMLCRRFGLSPNLGRTIAELAGVGGVA